MIQKYAQGVYIYQDKESKKWNWVKKEEGIEALLKKETGQADVSVAAAKRRTMASEILQAHNCSKHSTLLQLQFDQLISHDITFVGILQTARASGLEQFPIPYTLTNCHNSLCAVGGTINEDDHRFGLSCAKRYGGNYVPAHQAVIHQYAREQIAKAGQMVLGSDSHTRYGALGTMAIGEGGPELVKQLLQRTYDIPYPDVVGVYLTGKPNPYIGPQDIALAIIQAVFLDGFVKNSVMEFIGDGISNLTVEQRMGIDVMTTETTCLSSIWETDQAVLEYYQIHDRAQDYRELKPGNGAYYDRMLVVDLSKIVPMIAMPFHPSNVYSIAQVQQNLADVLHEVEEKAKGLLEESVSFSLQDHVRNGVLYVDQGVIAGCAGGMFENICDAADILKGSSIGDDAFSLSIYPASQPIFMELVQNGVAANIMQTGAILKTAFCGPCFGAGDVPANQAFSIRHTTRNFPNREGSKTGNGQIASVALMDAKSIAATARNKGILTAATEWEGTFSKPTYFFDRQIYRNRVYYGFGHPKKEVSLAFGPGIVDWPAIPALKEHILLQVASVITDPVTTTDELIPSGETSSYRSNPFALAEFTLSRKDPLYVAAAKQTACLAKEKEERKEQEPQSETLQELWQLCQKQFDLDLETWDQVEIGSVVYAKKPGDGSAREQAASCQRVLGGLANIAQEYATKRYRSNLINWGMIPFLLQEEALLQRGDWIFIPHLFSQLQIKPCSVAAFVLHEQQWREISLVIDSLTKEEIEILKAGCLINYYRGAKKEN